MRETSTLKIGISGVRGVIGESLTPRLITSFAGAFGTYCGSGRVLIGTDTRPSREMVTQAANAGLLSVGCAPVNAGIVPVPALQLHVRRTGAAGGIGITASHNPEDWNALKFFGPDGIVLRPNQFSELLDLYHQGEYPRVGAQEICEIRTDDSAIRSHREAVLGAIEADAIRERGFRVVVDACNGAAFQAAPAFLQALGCEVIEVHTEPDSPFPRDPEPTADQLGDLTRLVTERGADVGFALDADADRLAIVDEAGRPLGEDVTLVLAVQRVLRSRPGPVVVSLSTTRAVEEVAIAAGCPVHRTPVGEINVVESMLEHEATIGGEGNGGVIAPWIHPCRDSFVAMGLVLESLAREAATTSDLASRLPRWSIVKTKLPRRARDIAPALRSLRYRFSDEELDLRDGLRVSWPDRWLHVRGSNTEPVLRIAAEAREEETARELVRVVVEHLGG